MRFILNPYLCLNFSIQARTEGTQRPLWSLLYRIPFKLGLPFESCLRKTTLFIFFRVSNNKPWQGFNLARVAEG